MTTQQPITIPDGTTIQFARANRVKVEAQRWDYFGITDRFLTTIEIAGNITIDPAKPVYILQFEDDEEGKAE